ncbi:hypothetical protein RchiOBHm_Chr3g0488091 [Rosa chinensis]|uniref:Uncharacterized protein n=1 Tax=Rosa chinensis TaxID=74649 RepID=A0A2P6RFN5_ROSCH|nr:hypothetical protein RchiOBHm_Chr3g0488091 [Rosa chinensis]
MPIIVAIYIDLQREGHCVALILLQVSELQSQLVVFRLIYILECLLSGFIRSI